MGNKSQQDQSAQTQMNDYERRRLLRVQENQAILRDMGVKNIAKSLTSLVESKKTKKVKVKPTYTNDKDVDYIPDQGGDSEEDLIEEQTQAKRHRPQYIAPMSMNKLANLAKQRRVVAPSISHKFPFDSNSMKQNQSRATMTMGELILSSKGSQRQSEVFKQTLAKPTSVTSGTKRKLFLVDDDDAEDYEISQDREHDDVNNDENEGDTMRSQDEVDEDDEYEDMDRMTFPNIQNGIQEDDSEDDLEKEDDVLVQEQFEGLQLEKATEISKTKKRGPIMMHGVHVRNANECEVIICNEFGQPIGPVTEEKDIVGQFSRFLGTIARNYNYAPLIYKSWHKVPQKDKMWECVLEKYIVPDAAKSWVLKSIGSCWSVYKCRIKKKHFYEQKDNKTRWKNRPKSIPENDFSRLLSLWNNKDVMKRCLRAKELRMSQKNNHSWSKKFCEDL